MRRHPLDRPLHPRRVRRDAMTRANQGWRFGRWAALLVVWVACAEARDPQIAGLTAAEVAPTCEEGCLSPPAPTEYGSASDLAPLQSNPDQATRPRVAYDLICGANLECPGNTQLPAGCIMLNGTTTEEARWLECYRQHQNCLSYCALCIAG